MRPVCGICRKNLPFRMFLGRPPPVQAPPPILERSDCEPSVTSEEGEDDLIDRLDRLAAMD